jgi:DNA/RNA endonuclease YhcR with UshA esterase domain
MKHKAGLTWLLIGVVVASGCTCASPATPTTKPLPTQAPTQAPTEAPSPTPTPFSTQAPEPTELPTATPTSIPEDTATPTLSPTPEDTPTPAVVLTGIGTITAGNAGEEVTVEGEVVGAASFSAGFKFTLDDGTGQITLLMWHNVYDECWAAPEINLGAQVRATGEVGEYEGELQIAPDFGGDIKSVKGAQAWGTPRDIGSLSGGDEGLRVMIEGRVIRAEGGSSWVKISVGDDTGEVVVFVWRSVLDRIPDNTGLGQEGTRVRVVGTLEVYRSNLQVTPTLPYDVVVLGTQ